MCGAQVFVQILWNFSPIKTLWLKKYGVLTCMCVVMFGSVSSLKVTLKKLGLLSKPCSLYELTIGKETL